MIIDEIEELAARHGVAEPRDTAESSRAAAWLAAIEKKLGIDVCPTFPLATRLRIAENHDLKVGDNVTYVGGMAAYHFVPGTVSRLVVDNGVMVLFDGDKRPRFFLRANLKKEKNMSITSTIKANLTILFPPRGAVSGDQVARDLLTATLVCTAADAAKKKAKAALITLGIGSNLYRPGTVTLFDSNLFTIQAVTKEPTSKLDQALLTIELKKAGLSQAKITAAFSAAMVENKPATSIAITEK